MNLHHRPVVRPARGFTLVELMVGVVLGMLAVAAIAQVLVFSEGSKRSITSGADAQISGALGLFTLQREVAMAGYGISAFPDALGCTTNYQRGSTTASTLTLAPVIIGALSNGSNSITVLRSTKPSFSVPLLVTEPHPADSTEFTVQSAFGAAAGDLFVAVPTDITTTQCRIFQVSTAPVGNKVQHVSGETAPWNAGTSGIEFPASSYLLNLGSMSGQRYSVNSNSLALEVNDFNSASGGWSAAKEVQPQVVMMRALYGKDTNNDGAVDTYDAVTPTTNAGWTQVRSMRLLLIARSGQPEKSDEPTPALLQWDVGSESDTVAGSDSCHEDRRCIPVDLSGLGNDFRNYRYKTYDTVVPLRNMLWKA